MLQGVEALDETVLNLEGASRRKKCWTLFLKSLNKLENTLPLDRLNHKIKDRFDKLIASFFNAFNFIVKYSVVFMFAFTPFMVFHISTFKKEVNGLQKSYTDICYSYIPCFILYS